MKTELEASTRRKRSTLKLIIGVIIVTAVLIIGLLKVKGRLPALTDTAIELAVENQIAGSEAVDGYQAQAACKDGLVTISEVSSWAQWQLAMDLAIEAGARKPHNMIETNGVAMPSQENRKDTIYVPE